MDDNAEAIHFYNTLPQNSEKKPEWAFLFKRVKSSNFYSIFANVSPILIKLGMGMHICLPKLTSKKSLRISKSKTTDGTQLEKANKRFHAKLVKYSTFYSIFANVWPILMKFGTAMHIRLQKLNCEKSLRILTISSYSLSQSSENNQNKRFHVNCMKYSNFYDIFTY